MNSHKYQGCHLLTWQELHLIGSEREKQRGYIEGCLGPVVWASDLQGMHCMSVLEGSS